LIARTAGRKVSPLDNFISNRFKENSMCLSLVSKALAQFLAATLVSFALMSPYEFAQALGALVA
jgi:hypothetical protein